MNLKILSLIVVSVALSSLAQITLKSGMSTQGVQRALAEDAGAFGLCWTLVTNPFVVAGLGMYGLGAVMWLFVLARLEVSLAYPFVGLGFIMTMLFGALILGEQLNAWRIAGTLLVVAGVVIIARS